MVLTLTLGWPGPGTGYHFCLYYTFSSEIYESLYAYVITPLPLNVTYTMHCDPVEWVGSKTFRLDWETDMLYGISMHPQWYDSTSIFHFKFPIYLFPCIYLMQAINIH